MKMFRGTLVHHHLRHGRYFRQSTVLGVVFAVFVIVMVSRCNLQTGHVTPGGDGSRDGVPHRSADSGSQPDIARILMGALAKVEKLQADVNAGRIVPKFGSRAESIVADATNQVQGEQTAAQISTALDGVLRALFLQQLTLLKRKLLDGYCSDSDPKTALARADDSFVIQAQALVPSGVDWNFETDRAQLQADLRGLLMHNIAVAKQKTQTVKSEKASVDVLQHLRHEMQELSEALTGGDGTVLWTRYRLQDLPLQVAGRYNKGRTNVEVSLLPDADPAKAEAGFVHDLTDRLPVGVSLNIGV